MKIGSDLKKDIVAAALKKNGGYGVTGFIEKKPTSNVVVLGISGMT
jgi:hypothetical protein